MKKEGFKMNIHLEDSYKVSKKRFNVILDSLPISNYRSLYSLKMEWTTHNFLYNLGLWKSHTKDVDLNYPQKWYITLAYIIIGTLVWPFIK